MIARRLLLLGLVVSVAAAKKELQTEKKLVTFHPGKVGFSIQEQDGHVTEIDQGGQASLAGVQQGWKIVLIDTTPYSFDILKQKAVGDNDYDVTFAVREDNSSNVEGAPGRSDTLREMGGNATTLPLKAATLEKSSVHLVPTTDSPTTAQVTTITPDSEEVRALKRKKVHDKMVEGAVGGALGGAVILGGVLGGVLGGLLTTTPVLLPPRATLDEFLSPSAAALDAVLPPAKTAFKATPSPKMKATVSIPRAATHASATPAPQKSQMSRFAHAHVWAMLVGLLGVGFLLMAVLAVSKILKAREHAVLSKNLNHLVSSSSDSSDSDEDSGSDNAQNRSGSSYLQMTRPLISQTSV